jgi:hypothetical protein
MRPVRNNGHRLQAAYTGTVEVEGDLFQCLVVLASSAGYSTGKITSLLLAMSDTMYSLFHRNRARSATCQHSCHCYILSNVLIVPICQGSDFASELLSLGRAVLHLSRDMHHLEVRRIDAAGNETK